MIITRSPLRISLGGGGTDLPSYYEQHTGFLIAAAIDRYVYITLHDTFVDDLIVKYSKLERVAEAKDLEHPIIREAMDLLREHGTDLDYQRARSYWYAHIIISLGGEHGYMARSAGSMISTANDLMEAEGDE